MSRLQKQNRNQSETDFRTPQFIYEGAMKHFGHQYHLDVAASGENHLCPMFFDENDNALERHWFGHVWCNPPYHSIGDWVDKAIRECSIGKNCLSVTFLVPASTCTKWFEKAWAWAAHIVFLSGRIGFEGPHVRPGGNATNPSVLIRIDANRIERKKRPARRVDLVNIRGGEWG